MDVGFNSQNLLLFNIEPGLIGYREARLGELYQRLFARLEAVPGVQAVTASQVRLLAFGARTSSVYFPGGAVGPDGRAVEGGDSKVLIVRENFLETMQIPLLVGRTFTSQDDARVPSVAVVNQVFAQKYYPNENVIGKRFSFDGTKPGEIEIVVLAQDAKYTSQRGSDRANCVHALATVTACNASRHNRAPHAGGDPAAYISAVREAVREVDSKLPLDNIKTPGRAGGRSPFDGATVHEAVQSVWSIGPTARSCRTLRRNGLHRISAHTRDRRANGARSNAANCVADGSETGNVSGPLSGSRWD